MEINNYLRTPVKIEQLVQIMLSELDMLTLYADEIVETIDAILTGLRTPKHWQNILVLALLLTPVA